MNKKQFRNFDLFTISYPFTAIISFLHRLSGVCAFLFIPFLLWIFTVSLESKESFEQIKNVLTNPILKLIVWSIWTALWYHLIAGIRHLVMDIGMSENLKNARVSGAITILIAILLAVLTGLWLW